MPFDRYEAHIDLNHARRHDVESRCEPRFHRIQARLERLDFVSTEPLHQSGMSLPDRCDLALDVLQQDREPMLLLARHRRTHLSSARVKTGQSSVPCKILGENAFREVSATAKVSHVRTAPAPTKTAWAVQLRARAAVRALSDECAKDDVPVLPVKGIVTSALLYSDIAERPMLDADVRVRPRDLDRALVAARRAGAEIHARNHAYRSAILMFDGMQVDVETGVGPPGLCDLCVDAMLSRASQSTLLGFPHLVPELHDHGLLLYVNVFKDKIALAQPASLEDVRRVSAKLDLERFTTLANEAHATTLVWIVADALGLPAAPPSRRGYARLMRTLQRWPSSLPTRALARWANDRPSARIQALFHMSRWWMERGRRL
jgi:hypothetical protein